MKKIALYSTKSRNPLAQQELMATLEKVETMVLDNGYLIDNDNPDMVIAVGGDGTLLRAVHHYMNNIDKISFVGVNSGTLGFLMPFSVNDLEKVLENKEFKVETHSLLKCVVKKGDEERSLYSVNEFRFENPFHTLIADVYINGDHLETFRGNGLAIASSLGSSAYNKSLGGAVIDPNLETIQLTEIAAIENNVYRSLGSSLVLSKENSISLKLDFKYVIVGYDHESLPLDGVESIKVELSDKKLHLVKNPLKNNIDILKGSFIK